MVVGKLRNLYFKYGERGTSSFYRAHQVVIGDLSGKEAAVTENYRKHIIRFYGEKNGQEIYERAYQAGQEHRASARQISEREQRERDSASGRGEGAYSDPQEVVPTDPDPPVPDIGDVRAEIA